MYELPFPGPFISIYDIVRKGKFGKHVSVPIAIVLLSACALVFGLATFGHHVTRGMGIQMARITPSRGFAAELSTALVVLVASQWGLPNSSSQCITGGIVGVGLLEGAQGINWKFFGQTYLSWVCTPFTMAAGTALLFSMGVFSPCI